MFAHSKAFLLATATVICLPALASAATVLVNGSTFGLSAGTSFVAAETINPGDNLEFRFTVLEDLFVQAFTLSASGLNAGADVGDIRFGFTQPGTGAFDPITVTFDVASGVGVLAGDTFKLGDVFSIFVEDGISQPVGVTLAFNTATISAIPLPATGLMLLPFLLGGGIASWRRRTTTHTTHA